MTPALSSLIEYEIYVPTVEPSGEAHATEGVADIRARLVDYFGGLTDTRMKNEGLWRIGSVTVRDEVVVWRTLSDKGLEGDRYMSTVKRELEERLGQDVVLVVRREVEVMG